MPKVVFAWEAGENLGHLAKDIPVALRLREAGASVQFIVRRLDTACALLTRHGFEYFQAPASARRFSVDGKARTHSEWFGKLGYWDRPNLMGQVRAWQSLFKVLDADVVVADFSPTSLLAARIGRLPAVLLGTGFEIPPALAPMPWRSCDEIENRGLMIETERRSLAAINHLYRQSHTPPIGSVSDLFRNLPRCLTTFAELDHYVNFGFVRDAGEFIGHVTHATRSMDPAMAEPAQEAKTKRRVFVYLRSFVPGLDRVLEALAAVDVRASCYIPDLAPQVRAIHAGKVEFLDEPLDVNAELDAFDLVINYAGAGTVSETLSRGIPMLLLPSHNEQALTAAAAERLGAAMVLRDVADASTVARSIRAMLEAGSPWKACARAFMVGRRDHDPSAAVDQAARTIIAAARRRPGERGAGGAGRENVLVATELGALLGEVALARPLARALSEAGALPVVAGFEGDSHAWGFEHGVITAARWKAVRDRRNPPRNHAELLFDEGGFLDADSLLASVRYWMSVLEEHAIDKVVGVAAPVVMLAAHVLERPRVAVDSGYYTTMGALAGSPASDGGRADPHEKALETRILATANAVLEELGGKPLKSFEEIFAADLNLVAACAELDPHRRAAGSVEHVGALFETIHSPTDASGGRPESAGCRTAPRIAVCLEPGDPDHDRVLNALLAADVVVDVMARTRPASEGPLHANLRVHATTRSMEHAWGFADLAICHGEASLVHPLVYLGVAVAAFPRDACQRALGRALQAGGIGWVRQADSNEPVESFVARLLVEASEKKAKAESLRRAHPPGNAWNVCRRILAAGRTAEPRDREAFETLAALGA